MPAPSDLKITALTAIGANPVNPATFPMPMVDTLDNSMAASGTTKKVTVNQILGAGGTATLASATITGAATVGTTLGVTGVSTFAAGTLSLPALTTTGDTNTGIYYPAADTFAVTTGGVERYRVDSTGLGIGANATSKLTVNGEISVTDNFALRLGSTQAGGATLLYNGSGNLDITPRSGFHTKLVDGNLIIGTSGKGIDFSAVTGGTGTATGNVLNDYEEGTFTPTVFGSTIAGAAAYTTRTGRYTKIGNLVSVQVYINWSAITGGTGDLRFGGLPFTSSSDANVFSAVTFGYTSISLTANNVLVGYISSNQTNIEAQQYPVGGGSITNVPIDTAAEVIYSLTYRV